jgi:hypothetical protein
MSGNGEEAQGSMMGRLSYYRQNDYIDADYNMNEEYSYQNLNYDGYDYERDVDGWPYEYPFDEDHRYPGNFDYENFYDGRGYDDQYYHSYHDDAPYDDEEDGMNEVPWYEYPLVRGYAGSEDYQLGNADEDYSYPWGVNDQQYDQGGHSYYTQNRVTSEAGQF